MNAKISVWHMHKIFKKLLKIFYWWVKKKISKVFFSKLLFFNTKDYILIDLHEESITYGFETTLYFNSSEEFWTILL